MSIALRIETVVQPDGKIEINVPQLTPGQHVTVVVEAAKTVETVETVETSRATAPTPQKRRAADILVEALGYLQFQAAEEVDEYIREERDSWER